MVYHKTIGDIAQEDIGVQRIMDVYHNDQAGMTSAVINYLHRTKFELQEPKSCVWVAAIYFAIGLSLGFVLFGVLFGDKVYQFFT